MSKEEKRRQDAMRRQRNANIAKVAIIGSFGIASILAAWLLVQV